MIDCTITGDSISAGLASVMHECRSTARVGMGSGWIVRHTVGGYHVTIISMGSNDLPRFTVTAANAERVARIATGCRIWIAPANGGRGPIVRLAARLGDALETFAPGKDGVHPRSYGSLAGRVRARMAHCR